MINTLLNSYMCYTCIIVLYKLLYVYILLISAVLGGVTVMIYRLYLALTLFSFLKLFKGHSITNISIYFYIVFSYIIIIIILLIFASCSENVVIVTSTHVHLKALVMALFHYIAQ